VSEASDVSVYVHFPWCLKKCPYCDFNSHGTSRDAIPQQAYTDAVRRELAWRLPGLSHRRLVSIFFGGGTPSLWEPSGIASVIADIRGAFASQVDDVEITAECNPTSLDQARTAALREAGINRVSIGIQSLDNARLQYLGRLHDSEGALKALHEATREMDRVSGDLMFGMPGQKPADFLAELSRVLDTGVKHVSAYALTIEPGTQFGELHRKGRLPIATDDDYAETFLAAESLMASRGFGHYEVSNYAQPGEEARHNIHYWRGGTYLGVGAGAVGMSEVGCEEGHARRWRSRSLPAAYMRESGSAEVEEWSEPLDLDARIREALMLGLRSREGLSRALVKARTGRDVLEGREAAVTRRVERGELLLDAHTLRVPQSKWLALDGIVADLF
jgi:putative oxygen-independent coproporphyrinogen III oxidase